MPLEQSEATVAVPWEGGVSIAHVNVSPSGSDPDGVHETWAPPLLVIGTSFITGGSLLRIEVSTTSWGGFADSRLP